ncbi:MAG: zinc ribbon domain-containing protein [Candidatus Thiodiazotropha sp.]
MKSCRQCQHSVSEDAIACPNCGAPYPAQADWNGWGYEYKSKATLLGLLLLHVSFKYRPNKVPVVAKGVIAIGQFGVGIINLSQFGIGLFSLSQFTISGFAIAQFAIAYSCIAQFGLYIDQGVGQFMRSLSQLLGTG